jgi:hypothetical protein
LDYISFESSALERRPLNLGKSNIILAMEPACGVPRRAITTTTHQYWTPVIAHRHESLPQNPDMPDGGAFCHIPARSAEQKTALAFRGMKRLFP